MRANSSALTFLASAVIGLTAADYPGSGSGSSSGGSSVGWGSGGGGGGGGSTQIISGGSSTPDYGDPSAPGLPMPQMPGPVTGSGMGGSSVGSNTNGGPTNPPMPTPPPQQISPEAANGTAEGRYTRFTELEWSDAYVIAQAEGQPLPDTMRQAMAVADTNRDGELSTLELQSLRGAGLTRHFVLFDTDGDRALSRKELTKAASGWKDRMQVPK